MNLKLKQGILLKKAVAAVAIMASKARIHFGPNGLSLKALEPDSKIMVEFRIGSSCFECFEWNVDTFAEINLEDLDSVLDPVGEGSVSISTDERDDNLFKFTFDDRREDHIHLQCGNIREPLTLNEASEEIRSIVWIPSEGFINILTHLSFFSKSVHVSITHNQLKLSAMNREIVLTKEKRECMITSVAKSDRIQFSIGLEHMAAFLNASTLSPEVRIYIPALPGSPFILSCPVGNLGNIMFFFPTTTMTKKRKIIPETLNLFHN